MSTSRAFKERDKMLLSGDSDLFTEIERCCMCDEPTGKGGRSDDSLYDDNGGGPYCQECWDKNAPATTGKAGSE